jgi:hypothetical protein
MVLIIPCYPYHDTGNIEWCDENHKAKISSFAFSALNNTLCLIDNK